MWQEVSYNGESIVMWLEVVAYFKVLFEQQSQRCLLRVMLQILLINEYMINENNVHLYYYYIDLFYRMTEIRRNP
jgi:hypothetical protein